MMNLDGRLRRLEQQPEMSDDQIRERCEALGRAHDLYPPAIYEEMQRWLRMSPAERDAALTEFRAAGVAFDPAECAQHGGPPCGEILGED